MKVVIQLSIIFVLLLTLASCSPLKNWHKNPVEFTEEMALKRGKKVLVILFGRKTVNKYKPYTAILENGVWKVSGTLKTDKGGTPYIELSKYDGMILKTTHY